MDLFERLQEDLGPLGKHAKVGHGYYTFPKLEGELGPEMQFNGKPVLNWSINNYLGLAVSPEAIEFDRRAVEKFGLSYPMGSRMMSGNSNFIEDFEADLAKFTGKEDSVVLNYGYQGIMSIVNALTTRHDAIVYDSDCHACIIDAIRMHDGGRFVFPHNDIEKCESQLKRAKEAVGDSGGILVITEGVFGMLGDIGKLREIVTLKEHYSFRLIIDDAHGFGTMGDKGRGTADALGVQEDIDLYFSTFAKALASIGGFVAGPKKIIRYLRYNMRSQIYAKTLPSAIVYTNKKRLQLLIDQPERKHKLWEIAKSLQTGLRGKGFDLGSTQSVVTPVMLKGNVIEAGNLIIDLRERFQIFCSLITYPVVPKHVIMLRLIPTVCHTMEHVERTIQAFESIAKNLENNAYANDKICMAENVNF